MFVKSYKITGRRLIAIGVMFLAVVGLVVYGIGTKLAQPRETTAPVEAGTKVSGRAAKGVAKTEADRLAFIAQFGWQADAEPVEVTEVIIPEEFDDVYTQYNELQKQQGYDLEKYRGERCKRYAYAVLNYPDTKQEVRLNMMVLGGRVIGGDVSSTALGGFMQGFAKDSSVMSTEELETSVQEHSTLAEDGAPIEETMASDLAAMEEELRAGLEADASANPPEEVPADAPAEKAPVTEAQMPTD